LTVVYPVSLKKSLQNFKSLEKLPTTQEGGFFGSSKAKERQELPVDLYFILASSRYKFQLFFLPGYIQTCWVCCHCMCSKWTAPTINYWQPPLLKVSCSWWPPLLTKEQVEQHHGCL